MDYTQRLKELIPKRIHPQLGAIRRRLISLPARTRRQWRLLLEDEALPAEQRGLLALVEPRISPGDGMYTGNGAQYFKVGLSAVACIESAIEAAALTSVSRVLDLPCGHGRVLRFLVRRFPEAEFTASDLDRKGVDFCARTFGVKGVYSQPDLSELSLGHHFDLIWCGSLITHLDSKGIRDLLAFFARHLLPGGLLVFTTHGERVVHRLQRKAFDYGIDDEDVSFLITSFREKGFGFANYPGANGYGVSLTTPDWIRAETNELGLNEVYFREHGWDEHQDVYGFVRPS